MYTTEIMMLDGCKKVGPTFFSGDVSRGEYKTLSSARGAAEKWAEEAGLVSGTYKLVSRIVGCL